MAFIALRAGNDVITRFAFSRCSIVAACATPGDGVVIEHRGYPGIGTVAIIAGRATGDVVAGFASGDSPIMTTGAGAQHRAVVDPIGRRPARAVMAVIAGICSRDMGGIFTRRSSAVVTA